MAMADISFYFRFRGGFSALPWIVKLVYAMSLVRHIHGIPYISELHQSCGLDGDHLSRGSICLLHPGVDNPPPVSLARHNFYNHFERQQNIQNNHQESAKSHFVLASQFRLVAAMATDSTSRSCLCYTDPQD